MQYEIQAYHIFAISGLHLSFVAGLFFIVLRNLLQYLKL
ncbi:ComEC/Rec2 family competence protein [Wolbachia endosymbiont of Mansonella ozzardi]|nr:ComEC/Rec2 family competence protein [Wolbachia endosymbiont of Mansonella ozzardi]